MKPADTASPVALLASLNAHIARASRAAGEAQGLDTQTGAAPWPPLRSAQRFGETWERLGAELQVQQARQRAPQNAGPLNPQRLVVETLARMGELSPHYLRRFLAHAETLLWLEQAQGQLRHSASQARASAGRPGRAGRGAKQP